MAMELKAELPNNLVQFEILPRLSIKSLARFMCVCKQWKSYPLCIVLFEILPRLPLKVVARFVLVCKQWQSFLSRPEFARLHLRHESRYKLLLLDQHAHPRTFRTLDCEALNLGSTTIRRYIPFTPHQLYCTSILASLDGLVCLALQQYKELAFWNPLTGSCKKVSNYNFKEYSDTIGLYTDSSNDYNLLHISASLEAFIYSLRLNSWRKIERLLKHADHLFGFKWSPATFSGQNLYFVLFNALKSKSCIINFDVNLEKFREIKFPSVPSDAEWFCGCLVVLDGCIHLCVAYLMTDSVPRSEGDLWRMDNDGDGWVKVKHFSSGQLPRSSQICITRNGRFIAVSKNKNSFKKIDMEDFAGDDLYLLVEGRKCSFQRTIYVETLVSPIISSS